MTDSNPNLFHPDEFDAWATSYDEAVQDESIFPFTGYSQVLDTILELAGPEPGDKVLDLGCGTGNLAERFAAAGCQVWGLDFSGEMLARARRKLPEAVFAQADVRGEYPPEFQRRYHFIVSAYTFHHFPLPEKVEQIRRLADQYLLPGGAVIIGDIAFDNAAGLDRMRDSAGDQWDDEFYWLADESLAALHAAGLQAEWRRVSDCAGVFRVGGKK
jgi:putative AdoMet-dependent methyltransferase